jgi:hypothetical protein
LSVRPIQRDWDEMPPALGREVRYGRDEVFNECLAGRIDVAVEGECQAANVDVADLASPEQGARLLLYL